ncbi:MAG: DUF4190 domain-containing protein [Jatrophihabitans sp.]
MTSSGDQGPPHGHGYDASQPQGQPDGSPAPYDQPYSRPPQYGLPGPGYPPGPAFPPAYGYPSSVGTNGLAIASLVLGILWLYWIGSILALILGLVARSQIKQRRQPGDGLAIAGIILGIIGVATLVIFIVFVIVAVNTSHSCYFYDTGC